MLIDITIEVTPIMGEETFNREKMAAFGHLGTHFDGVDKTFPLEFLRRKAVVFDVEAASGREIQADDFDISLVEKDMFVTFRTGFIERTGYGSKEYFSDHPQLSDRLIDMLLERHISIIGIDFAGVRRGAEHTP
ncbi:MAG: cyclase family protein, partial [Spirochaetales bacterium]|nr:cyclase family protein [Spirochaetales bacterium]